VVSAVPFHCTVEPLRNPVPFTPNTNAAPPAVVVFGLRLVMLSAVIVNVTTLEMVLFGLTTLILAAPAEAIRLAGTVAVN
jgi:hypothetical protein